MDSEAGRVELLGVSERARTFAENAIRFAWATPHFGLGEVAAGYRDADPVVQLFARFERDLRADNGLREALRPVETAPKDGSYFLFVGDNFDGGMAVVHWDDGLEWRRLDDGKNFEIAMRHESGLTGWIPLPQVSALQPNTGERGDG